jgi:hypothetical protein
MLRQICVPAGTSVARGYFSYLRPNVSSPI